MTTYRKLSSKEVLALANAILSHAEEYTLRAFLNNFYGDEAYQVDVRIEQTESGTEVYEVIVYSVGGGVVLPNLELPGWQTLVMEKGDEIDLSADTSEIIDQVCACMRRYNVYGEYHIPAVPCEVRVDAMRLPEMPDLYVAVGEPES